MENTLLVKQLFLMRLMSHINAETYPGAFAMSHISETLIANT